MRVQSSRRIVGGVSLIGFPLALLLSNLFDADEGDATSIVGSAIERPGALLGLTLTLLVSTVLLVPAVFTLVGLIRERGAILVHIGAFFGVLGALGHASLVTYYVVALGGSSGDRAAAIAFLGRVDDSSYVAVIFPLVISFGVALAFLALAAWRARLAGAWILGAITVAWAIEISGVGGHAGHFVRDAAMTVAFGWIGLRLLVPAGQAAPGWTRPDSYASTTA